MKHVPYWGPTNMRHGTKCRRPVFVHPRYHTTPSSVWRQIPFVHCSPPDIKQKYGKFINSKYLRNLTSPSQLCILFWVFLFALVFVNTHHRSWPSDFSHFRFYIYRYVLHGPAQCYIVLWSTQNCIRGTVIGLHVLVVNKTAVHRNTTDTIKVCSDFMCCVLGTGVAGKPIAEMCFSLLSNWTQNREGWWRKKSSVFCAWPGNLFLTFVSHSQF
jgi:hypothetical protein